MYKHINTDGFESTKPHRAAPVTQQPGIGSVEPNTWDTSVAALFADGLAEGRLGMLFECVKLVGAETKHMFEDTDTLTHYFTMSL